MTNCIKYLFFILIIPLSSQVTFAAEVFKTKGKKAIVRLDGMSVSSGDTLIVHSGRSKKAEVKVTKVKEAYIMVEIMKGRVFEGDTVSPSRDPVIRTLASDGDYYEGEDEDEDDYDDITGEDDDYSDDINDVNDGLINSSPPPPSSGAGEYDNEEYLTSSKSFAIGLLGGMSYNILTLKLPNSSPNGPTPERKNILTSGLGFDALVAMDYDFSDILGIRVLTGLQRFHAASKDSQRAYTDYMECYDSISERDCQLTLDLFTVGLQLQYYMGAGSEMMQTWIGIGGSINFVLKTRTNYSLKEVKNMGSVSAALGANISLTSKVYLPLQIDYNFSISSSSTVLAHFFGAKAGLMYAL